jgi:hypothetical protein
MIRSAAILFALLVLTSCSSILGRPDSSSAPYVKSFEEYFNHKVTVPILFTSLSGNTRGRCIFFRAPKVLRRIQIDSKYWARIEDWERELVIFHELGHCEFNMDHDKSKEPGIFFQNPKSIMYPYLFWQYAARRDHYWRELAKKKEAAEAAP